MKIKVLRLKMKLTQQQLAEKLGTTQQLVSWWEIGKTKPSAIFLIKMTRLFNCTIEDLIDE